MEAGTADRVGTTPGGTAHTNGPLDRVRRFTTETKQAFKTTEFWTFVVVAVAILLSAAAINGGDTGGTDEFIADEAWLYVAIVTGAYLISRGLAKAGTGDPYTEDRSDRS